MILLVVVEEVMKLGEVKLIVVVMTLILLLLLLLLSVSSLLMFSMSAKLWYPGL